jgi:8-oxo-dGTP diphosphatase
MSQKSMKRPGVGVGVVVLRDGKFLVMQRKGSHGAGTWSVPGGWMELGESFEEASVREIEEETGMKIKNISFVALTNNIMLDEGVHSLTVWMKADWEKGEPIIMEPEKCTDQKWVDFNILPKPLFRGLELLLESEFLPEVKRHLKLSKNNV